MTCATFVTPLTGLDEYILGIGTMQKH